MAKKIGDNTGSQDQLLRSVKADGVAIKLESGLKPNEEKLANSILNVVIQGLEANGKYSLSLTSKNTDAIMGRITTLLENQLGDFNNSELADVKSAIIDAINSSTANATQPEQLDANALVDKIANVFLEQLDKQLAAFVQQMQKLFDDNKPAESAAVESAAVEAPVPEPPPAPEAEKDDGDEPAPAPAGNGDIATEILSAKEELISYVNQQIKKILKKSEDLSAFITANFLDIASKVDAMQTIVLQAIQGLLPNGKQKKEQKKQAKMFNKMASDLNSIMDKLNSMFDNFSDVLVNAVAKGINKLYSVIFKATCIFMLKLFRAIIFPIMLLFGLALYLLAGPLMEILLPIMDFVKSLVFRILDFLEPVRDFLLNVMKRIFDAIEPALVAFFKGIASDAEEVGKGLVRFVNAVLTVLCLFMEGVGEYAEAIGKGLGLFVTIVLDDLCLLMKGFGKLAEAIGAAIGTVVLAVVTCVSLIVRLVNEIAEILIDICRIIHAPIRMIADFFNGMGSKSRAIGEMIGNIIYNFFKGFNTKAEAIGEAVAELVLVTTKIITKALKALLKVGRIIDMYVVAPIQALRIKFKSGLAKMAAYDGWGSSIINGLANAFGWGSLSYNEKYEAITAQNKSVGELIKEQQDKMQQKFDEEDRAAEAAEAAKQLEKILQAQFQEMLKNIHLLQDVKDLIQDKVIPSLGDADQAGLMSERLANIEHNITAVQDNIDAILKDERLKELADIIFSSKSFFESISEYGNAIGEALDKFAIEIVDPLSKVMEYMYNEVINGNMLQSIKETVYEAKSTLLTTLIEISQKICDILQQMIKSLSDATTEIHTSINDVLLQIIKSLSDATTEIHTSINDVLLQIIKSLSDAISKIQLNTTETLKKPTEDKKEEKSPFSFFSKLKKPSFFDFEKQTEKLKDKFEGFFSKFTDKFKKAEEPKVEVSAQVVLPEIKLVDDMQQQLTKDANALSENIDLASHVIKKEKLDNTLKNFNDGLMGYLNQMFGEVLEKLDKQPAALPIPMPHSNNNLAAMENNI